MRRRDVLRSGLALAAVPSLAAFASRSRPPRSPRWPRCWPCSGHAPYTLPRNHKWHADGIYDTGLLQEWHYWTDFFTDDDTGEGLGVSYNINHQAVRPGVVQYIAWFGTYGNPSRQRFRCTSADGTTHRFAGVLPRLRVEDEVCQHCDNEVHRHQGPLLTSNYDFHLRLAAKRSSASAPG